MNKHKSKIEGGFVVIPKRTIKCEQYNKLKSFSKAVFTAILTEFIRDKSIIPDNFVKITHNQMENISGISHTSVVRAVKELKVKNFMKVYEPGGLEGRPTTFQLNDRYLDVRGSPEAYW